MQGFIGLVQLYQVYRALCDDLFAQLALPKLAIRNEGDWGRYYQEILMSFQLPPASPEVLLPVSMTPEREGLTATRWNGEWGHQLSS